MTDPTSARRASRLAALGALALTLGLVARSRRRRRRTTGDYIVAVVNQELVTAAEVQQRLARVRAERRSSARPAAAAGGAAPAGGGRADRRAGARHQRPRERPEDRRGRARPGRRQRRVAEPADACRSCANGCAAKASTTRSSAPRCATRCWSSGCASARWRAAIRVSDAEIDALLERAAHAVGADAAAQHRADPGARCRRAPPRPMVGERRARAEAALRAGSRRRGLRGGRPRGVGGRQSQRGAARSACARPTACPTCSSRRCAALKAGEVSPELLRSGAGFHILKLIERKRRRRLQRPADRARHILLRTSAAAAAARRRPAVWASSSREILSGGTKRFEQAAPARTPRTQRRAGRRPGLGLAGRILRARVRGGDRPRCDVGGMSEPVVSRFGVHLIQVVDRRQVTLDAEAAARAGPQHPARAEVRGGLHRVAARPARPGLHRDARAADSRRRPRSWRTPPAKALRPALPDRRGRSSTPSSRAIGAAAGRGAGRDRSGPRRDRPIRSLERCGG